MTEHKRIIFDASNQIFIQHIIFWFVGVLQIRSKVRKQLAVKYGFKNKENNSHFLTASPQRLQTQVCCLFFLDVLPRCLHLCLFFPPSRQLNADYLLFPKVLVILFDHEVCIQFWVSEGFIILKNQKKRSPLEKRATINLQVQ